MAEQNYQSGFGNEFATEAVEGCAARGAERTAEVGAGALHRATQRNGLHSAAGHQPAHLDLSHPSVGDAQTLLGNSWRPGTLSQRPFTEVPSPPNQMRWNPIPMPEKKTDFVDGIVTMGGSGDPAMQIGVGVHLYVANAPMQGRYSTTPTAK